MVVHGLSEAFAEEHESIESALRLGVIYCEALGLLFNKTVNIFNLLDSRNVDGYNFLNRDKLTQDQYSFLKGLVKETTKYYTENEKHFIGEKLK